MCPSWKMIELVNGKDDIPYMKWKSIQMFETTNQRWEYSSRRIKGILAMTKTRWGLHPSLCPRPRNRWFYITPSPVYPTTSMKSSFFAWNVTQICVFWGHKPTCQCGCGKFLFDFTALIPDWWLNHTTIGSSWLNQRNLDFIRDIWWYLMIFGIFAAKKNISSHITHL